jgi:hypothetical protein
VTTPLQILQRSLKTYKPNSYPTLKGGEPVFIDGEFKKIATVLMAMRDVVLDHEERLANLEGP